MRTATTLTTNNLLRTHTFFVLGLVAHIVALLFISIYAMLASTGEASGPSGIETNDAVLSSISVLTIVILYISFAMELTWPMRIEETLIIILLWSLLGNLGSGLLFDTHCQPQSHFYPHTGGFSGDGIPSPQQPPPSPPGASSQTVQHLRKTNADESPPLPDEDIDVETDEAGVIVVKPYTIHSNGDTNGGGGGGDGVHASSAHQQHHSCGSWAMFDIGFSLLCVFSSLLSLLCDTKNYYLSVLFKTLSICITVLIFLVPIHCNRFRLASIEVLILKITLYNIVWNMNRFKRITESLIGNNYKTGIELVKRYQEIYDQLDLTLRQQQQHTTMPTRSTQNHSNDYSDSESEYDNSRNKRRRTSTTELYAADGDPNTTVPSTLFSLVDTLQSDLDPVRRRLYKRAQAAGNRQQQSYTASPLVISPQEQVVSDQLENFEELVETNRRYNTAWFASWKNRYYGERIVYLFDIASTIWILAICPIYLFTVVILLFWLAYYIRINMRELEDTNRTIADMSRLREETTPSSSTKKTMNRKINGGGGGGGNTQHQQVPQRDTSQRYQQQQQTVSHRNRYYDG